MTVKVSDWLFSIVCFPASINCYHYSTVYNFHHCLPVSKNNLEFLLVNKKGAASDGHLNFSMMYFNFLVLFLPTGSNKLFHSKLAPVTKYIF